VLGQYLLHAAAFVFPTAGKSDLVMVGVRRAFRELAGRATASGSATAAAPAEPLGAVTVAFDPRAASGPERTLDSWPAEERLRSIANFRVFGRDRHSFAGPKSRSLRRLTAAAAARGGVVVVVFPVSRLYAGEFLDAGTTSQFERELDALSGAVPSAVMLRLDRDPALATDGAFRDLVHLAAGGRRTATAALAAVLRR
jgi:hypothetical protein